MIYCDRCRSTHLVVKAFGNKSEFSIKHYICNDCGYKKIVRKSIYDKKKF